MENTTHASPASIEFTDAAARKVQELILEEHNPELKLRVYISGGGCSGFSYNMSFENAPGVMDKVSNFDDLKVYVDATSAMYLDGCIVDFV